MRDTHIAFILNDSIQNAPHYINNFLRQFGMDPLKTEDFGRIVYLTEQYLRTNLASFFFAEIGKKISDFYEMSEI